MAERTDALKSNRNPDALDSISDATSKVKQSVEQFVEDFDLQSVARRVENFGRENPVGLALTALTVGLAVGLLVKSPRRMAVKNQFTSG
jgi:hypothetical protein